MIQVSAGEFKAKCLKLMDIAEQKHETIIITKRGIPVAKLVPYEKKPTRLFGFMKNMIDLIKTKWNIQSDRDFWLIMLTYSLAGMAILPIKKIIFHLVGITDHTPFWVVVLVYIPLIPPAYQLGLIFFGTLLGQFNFVWGQAKKRAMFLSKPFRKPS